MIFDRDKQALILDGRTLTAQDIAAIKNTGVEMPLYDLFDFLQRWFDKSDYIAVHTSGSTGTPKTLLVEKSKMMQSARLTCEYLGLKEGDSALLCMNLRYIGAMMVVVRSLVCGLNLIVRQPSGHPLDNVETPPTFAAMVPMQVYNTLENGAEREILEKIKTLIIGGGSIDPELGKKIKNLQGNIYSTYGMTETLSHIALRRLNGEKASLHYVPFETVHLSVTNDDTLVINAPLICSQTLYTNDIVQLHPDGSFVVLGRKDNTINSGGIKIQPEEDERLLQSIIDVPFAITSVSDEKLGEAAVLLIEPVSEKKLDDIKTAMRRILPPYHIPHTIITIQKLPLTGNGKINRKECRKIATESI